ncbi:MAG: MOFRL family protein [Thermoplasmata archaeon]
MSLATALAEHSSYEALRAVGTLWKTGPTGTNVSDLRVLLAGPPETGQRGYGKK